MFFSKRQKTKTYYLIAFSTTPNLEGKYAAFGIHYSTYEKAKDALLHGWYDTTPYSEDVVKCDDGDFLVIEKVIK